VPIVVGKGDEVVALRSRELPQIGEEEPTAN
jgi:hypothetical protein